MSTSESTENSDASSTAGNVDDGFDNVSNGPNTTKKSSKTKYWLIGLGIFAVIVAIVLMVVFLYVLPKRRQEQQLELEKQKLIDKPKADAQIVKNQAFLASKPPSKLVEWTDYYTKFTYFSKDLISPGCEPVYYYSPQNKRSIVLCHGLSDSPYYIRAIADVFCTIGYNVYCPLLHMHGLKNPDNMTGVSVEEWKLNVGFAIETAPKKTPASVSVGGFSTGGALAVYFACKYPDVITGDIFLFSAALDLVPHGWKGNFKETLVRSFVAGWLDDSRNKSEPLVMIPDAYGYNYVDYSGSQQLGLLIGELDTLIPTIKKSKRIFAIHSEIDDFTSPEGVMELGKYVTTFEFLLIPKEMAVRHASVVLDMPLVYNDKVQYDANPLFTQIMDAMKMFVGASSSSMSMNGANANRNTANGSVPVPTVPTVPTANSSIPVATVPTVPTANGSVPVATVPTANSSIPVSTGTTANALLAPNSLTSYNSMNGPIISNAMLQSNAFVDINENAAPNQ